MKTNYTILSIIYPHLEFHEKCQIGEVSIKHFSCLGVEQYQYSEQEVDSLLKERSYSGGDLPESIYEELENDALKKENPIVNFYFESEEKAQFFQNWLSSLKLPLDSKIVNKEVQDWDAFWRKFYDIIPLSKNYSIVPSWKKEKNKETGKEIYIYPGRGFGTGNHETTYLCLEAFINHPNINSSKTLDFGCGSGILGIGTLKKDASSQVIFCDIDKEALKNTKENLSLNNLKEGNECLPENLAPQKSYSLIFANILKNVLEEKSHFLSHSLSSKGHLIISGILKEQEKDIINLYQGFNLNLLSKQSKGDWSCLLFQKK